ncbi:MAG: Na+/H+ antiporter NhaA [Dehalococcoidia bacterium]
MLPLQEFTRTEAAGGIVLLLAALVALGWANSPWSDAYHALIEMPLTLTLGDFTLGGSLHFWINDALMVSFFFLVGLEIKRELTVGELSTVRTALLPAAAAAGGMAVPALAFLALATAPGDRGGWAVPMATDIAFALGVASLLGPRVPLGLKAFLLALAIFDDIGATLVIALFYGGPLHLAPLAIALVLLGVIATMARLRARSVPAYLVLGAATWLATYESGVHPALVGVAIGLLTPWEAWHPADQFARTAADLAATLRASAEQRASRIERLMHMREQLERAIPPLDRLEHGLNAWVAFLVVPLFALANAGVDLRGGALTEAAASPIAWGVVAGLVLGKPVGIVVATWLALRLGAAFPAGVGWRGVLSVGVLAGIGFTVAIFVADLAYADEARLTGAKVGIFAASLVSGVVGYLLLRFVGVEVAQPEGRLD